MHTHLVDIGVNLTDKAFHNDLSEVVQDAISQDVRTLILTGTRLDELEQAIQICKQHPNHCYCTAGIHPHYAKNWTETYYKQLKALANHPKVVAIGETGLDFNRNFSSPEQQIHVFEQQLRLAAELQMPLFLHERDAHEEQLKLLKEYRQQVPSGVAHCFTGTENEMNNYLELDLYIGITGWVCDERRGLHLQKLVKDIPLDRLLLETDAPYLLPRTLKRKPKSRRNVPANLRHICDQVANLLDMQPEQLAKATTDNAKRLFNI